MAAKKAVKKKASKKRYAVQRHIEFGGLSNDTNVIDVPKFLSEVNHRLYRQSRVYKVKVNQVDPALESRQAQVYVLRDTWFLQKAYQMAKKTFDENTKQERASMSKGNMARWNDFRINLTPAAGTSYNFLSPIVRNNGTLSLQTLAQGEFVDSLVTREDSTDMSFGLFGLANSRWGILDEYDRTSDVDGSPANLVSGSNISAYSGLDDDNDDSSRAHLQDAGNNPPYDKENLGVATMFRHVGTLGGGGSGSVKMSTGFFDAPLGCVLVVSDGASGKYEIEIASGDYKGIHADNYLE